MTTKTNAPIVLAGSGRSGTSWLIEALALDRRLRPIFEPLHFKNVRNIQSDWWNQYLLPNNEHPELEAHMGKVFYGRPDSDWLKWMHFRIPHGMPWKQRTLQTLYLLPNYRPLARQRVVKVIKANLCLTWLQQKFHPHLVFITRHPCGVLASRKTMGWKSSIEHWLSQERLVQDHLQSKLELIHAAKTQLQKLAITWCLENFLPLRQIQSGELTAHHARYEDLVLEPEVHLEQLLAAVNYPADRRPWLIARILQRKRPSSDSLRKWENQLTTQEVDEILSYADAFGLLDSLA